MVRRALPSLLLLAACGGEPQRPVPPPPPGTPTARELMDGLCDGPEVIPLEVAGSRHFVQVTLTGPKETATFRFHVDTGGNTRGLLFDKAVATRLGFGSEAEMPKSIRIGTRDVALPPGALWYLGKGTYPGRKDWSVGQLGAGFLGRFVVCIDAAKGKLALGDPKTHVFPTPIALGAGVHMHHLFLQERGDNRAPYPFVHLLFRSEGRFVGGYGVLLDTGAAAGFLEDAQMSHLEKNLAGGRMAVGAAGDADMVAGTMNEKLFAAPIVELNSVASYVKLKGLQPAEPLALGPGLFVSRPPGTFQNLFGVLAPTNGAYGAVGNDVLNRFRLVVDYPGRRVFLQPSEMPASASASMIRVGVSVDFGADGCPVIRRITDTNDKATIDSLRAGDTIVEVGGKDACAMAHHELSAALAGPVGSRKKLVLRRGDQKVSVDLPTADLMR